MIIYRENCDDNESNDSVDDGCVVRMVVMILLRALMATELWLLPVFLTV